MVSFRPITWDNYQACTAMKVHEAQRHYVAPNDYSLVQAYVSITNGGSARPFAIYHGETMVGFIMFDLVKADPKEGPEEDSYEIWRLMIADEHQGKGYGKAAMAEALRWIRAMPLGEAKAVLLSYEPENTVAKGLYESFGFVDTGIIEDGEMIAKLML